MNLRYKLRLVRQPDRDSEWWHDDSLDLLRRAVCLFWCLILGGEKGHKWRYHPQVVSLVDTGSKRHYRTVHMSQCRRCKVVKPWRP